MTLDAGRSWTVGEARQFVREVGSIAAYLEQPCASMGELERHAKSCSLPLIADESARSYADLVDGLRAGCLDAIHLKPSMVGGITKAVRLRDFAQAMGVMILMSEPYGGPVAHAAMAQVAATVSSKRLLGIVALDAHPGAAEPAYASCASCSEQCQPGKHAWQDFPGLGVDVTEALLGTPGFSFSASEK